MSSLNQQIANQANALHSTGPKTPQGKARSAMNARQHGLCSKDLLIGPEQQPEFDHMLAGYYAELDPQGEIEQTLFDEVVGAAWQLRRGRRIQTELCSGPASYTSLWNDDSLQNKLERLARHHTRIERTLHRCLKELRASLAERHRMEAEEARNTLLAAKLKQISERSQSVPASEPSETRTPPHLAGMDTVLHALEENLIEQARKPACPQAGPLDAA